MQEVVVFQIFKIGLHSRQSGIEDWPCDSPENLLSALDYRVNRTWKPTAV
jgi:hypothetical protein